MDNNDVNSLNQPKNSTTVNNANNNNSALGTTNQASNQASNQALGANNNFKGIDKAINQIFPNKLQFMADKPALSPAPTNQSNINDTVARMKALRAIIPEEIGSGKMTDYRRQQLQNDWMRMALGTGDGRYNTNSTNRIYQQNADNTAFRNDSVNNKYRSDFFGNLFSNYAPTVDPTDINNTNSSGVEVDFNSINA